MTDPRSVTRSSTARTAEAAGRVSRERVAQPNGWWGMAMFMCAEVALFGTLIGSYFYLSFISRSWPPAGIKPPEVALPLLATAVLVSSSAPMWLAFKAARAGRRGALIRLMTLALVVQCCYFAFQIILFRHDLLKFSPRATAYGSIYFTLLGIHHAHVLLGILLDLAVLWHLCTHGLTNYWLIGVRGAALYWHVVNLLAVIVVLVQISPSL
jgi:heme/copper-type cytochrome/quinol oxidase subunit 3